jgi:hypothetical protein
MTQHDASQQRVRTM